MHNQGESPTRCCTATGLFADNDALYVGIEGCRAIDILQRRGVVLKAGTDKP